jgi:hypothetical protein
LFLYAGVITGSFVLAVLGGFGPWRSKTVHEITVHRINVVEPDGTLRMVISNHDQLPGIIVHGEESPLERPQAGMLFFNDEASEIGGLIFGGRRNAEGQIEISGVSLSFDKYEANQIVQLIGVEDSQNRFAGLAVLDSIAGSEVYRRIWLGRGDDGSATLALLDAAGRKRLLLQVQADGGASVSLLDSNGNVVRNLIQ